MATLTIRMVRSFEYRNIKSLVLRDLDLNTLTLADLIVKANEAIQTLPAYATYRTHPFGYYSFIYYQSSFPPSPSFPPPLLPFIYLLNYLSNIRKKRHDEDLLVSTCNKGLGLGLGLGFAFPLCLISYYNSRN